MREIGAYQAKTHLSRLLDEVAKGKSLRITKNGKPVAMLVPIPKHEKQNPQEIIKRIRKFRQGILLKGLSIRKMIREGRRF